MAFSPETFVILKNKINALKNLIDNLESFTHWIGVTTTQLSDGATTNPIIINGTNVTASEGSVTSYNGTEFIFNGSFWQEFGGDSSNFITKADLLQTTGEAVDNTMSQKAITDSLVESLEDMYNEMRADFQHKIYRDVYRQIMQPVETIVYNNNSYRKSNGNIANEYIITLLSDTDEMTMILRDNGEVHEFDSIYYEYSEELDRYCLFLGEDLSEEETILNPDALFLFSEDESSAQLYLGNTISANSFFSYDIYRIDSYQLPGPIPVDVKPEEYSGNLITSGAVYNEIKNSNFIVHEIYDSTLEIDRLDKRWGDIAGAFEFGKVCFCGSWDPDSETGGYSLISWIANLNGKYGIWTTGSPSTDDPDYWCDNESDYPYIHE